MKNTGILKKEFETGNQTAGEVKKYHQIILDSNKTDFLALVYNTKEQKCKIYLRSVNNIIQQYCTLILLSFLDPHLEVVGVQNCFCQYISRFVCWVVSRSVIHFF